MNTPTKAMQDEFTTMKARTIPWFSRVWLGGYRHKLARAWRAYARDPVFFKGKGYMTGGVVTVDREGNILSGDVRSLDPRDRFIDVMVIEESLKHRLERLGSICPVCQEKSE